MPTWPSQFCPLINSYQESPPDNVIRTKMDKGPDKIRRRTTANIRPVSFKMFLKNEDIQILDDFYVIETFSGSEPFDFINPRSKQSVKARFVSFPIYSNRSTGYEVSVQLEILP